MYSRCMAQRTQEQKNKHAEYMRKYYAEHPGYKSTADKKHRQKYIEKLRQYDSYRAMTPERKAQKNEGAKRRHAANPEEYKKYHREYYLANKQKSLESQRIRMAALEPEAKRIRLRKYGLKHAHGITIEQYDAMLLSQGGCCAICKQAPTVGHNKRLHVDHDHATEVIRGLLCMFCNHAMERVDRVPNWTELAAEYVARPR